MENTQHITKSERKHRRKLEKEARKKEAIRNRNRKKIIKISIGIFVVAIFTWLIFFNKPDVTDKGILKLSSPVHDFGVVSLSRGTVSAQVPIVNVGEGDLTITSLDSSCGCTTASITSNNVEGPVFQMANHGKNPKNWKITIKSGEQAYLNVYYDPRVHPNLVGPVTRVITIYSDDPLKPVQELRVRVNQVA